MIRLTALLALCLVVSSARADDLDVIVDKTASAGSRGQAYYRLTAVEFRSIAAKLAGLIGIHGVVTSIGPTTQEPWKEARLAEYDRIGCTLRQLWRKHFETKRPRDEDIELLLDLLEDPSVGRGRYMPARELVSRLHFGSLQPDSSMPRMEGVLRRLDRLVQDAKGREGVARYLLEMLFEHGDQNKYLDLALELSSSGDTPVRRAEFFQSCTRYCRPDKLSPENRRKYLRHAFSLLEQVDDGQSGHGYFLASQIGRFIGIPPFREGQGSFAPDQRLPEYQGPHGLKEKFFQDTVNNACKWWKENEATL